MNGRVNDGISRIPLLNSVPAQWKKEKLKKKLYTIPGSSNYFQRRAMLPSNSSEIWFTCNRQTIQLRRAGTSLKFNERRSFAGLLACAYRVKLCRNKSGRDEWIERMLCSFGPPPSSADTLPTLYRIIYSVSSGVIKKERKSERRCNRKDFMNSANSVEKITFLYYFTNSIVNPEKEKHKEEES